MQSPGVREADKWSASVRMQEVKGPQFYRAWWTERGPPFGGNVLWVTWQLQSLGTLASSPGPGGAVK